MSNPEAAAFVAMVAFMVAMALSSRETPMRDTDETPDTGLLLRHRGRADRIRGQKRTYRLPICDRWGYPPLGLSYPGRKPVDPCQAVQAILEPPRKIAGPLRTLQASQFRNLLQAHAADQHGVDQGGAVVPQLPAAFG